MREETCSYARPSRDRLEILKFQKRFFQILALNRIVGVCKTAGKSLRTGSTLSPKTTNKTVGAQDGCATYRTQRRDRTKVGARRATGEARAPRSGLCAGLRNGIRQSSGGPGNGGVAEEKADAGSAAPRLGSQRMLEAICVTERHWW